MKNNEFPIPIAYKKEKYGWTEDEFKEFNKSRAVTLENQIKKYGEEHGAARFKSYQELQAHAGCSLEYFIKKHGSIELGTAEYNQLNVRKSPTFDNFVRKYGEHQGSEKYKEMIKTRSETMMASVVSKTSTKLFDIIYETVYNSRSPHVRYAALNHEHVVYDYEGMKPFFLDFVDLSTRKVIEYQGSYWHMHSSMYSANDVNPSTRKTAQEIWDYDTRQDKIIRLQGYDIMYVLEHEYLEYPEKIINTCTKFLTGQL